MLVAIQPIHYYSSSQVLQLGRITGSFFLLVVCIELSDTIRAYLQRVGWWNLEQFLQVQCWMYMLASSIGFDLQDIKSYLPFIVFLYITLPLSFPLIPPPFQIFHFPLHSRSVPLLACFIELFLSWTTVSSYFITSSARRHNFKDSELGSTSRREYVSILLSISIDMQISWFLLGLLPAEWNSLMYT